MKFDTIITGGGLSSLICGIKLQKAGKKCLIVSAGQNALHFSSGSFGLLGRLPDGTPVEEPLSAISQLPAEHPYSKIGAAKIADYVKEAPAFLSECGVSMQGSADGRNLYRLTALGTFKPSWLALSGTPVFDSKDAKIGSKVLIVNFAGFLDFNTRFIAEGLEKRGATCRIEAVRIDAVDKLRKNPTEMRSVNIARVMAKEENLKQFASAVQTLLKDEDTVIAPDIFGYEDPFAIESLEKQIPARMLFVGTMPPSAPGIRTQKVLKQAFEAAGGTFLAGDVVIDPEFDGNRVVSVRTANLGEVKLYADNFVLASGSFFGKGLEATLDKVKEPVFGLDVEFPEGRTSWYNENVYEKQPFMGVGVKVDDSFRPSREGAAVENLYVIGAEVGGCNSLYEGCGAGVAIMTAFKAAEEILG